MSKAESKSARSNPNEGPGGGKWVFVVVAAGLFAAMSAPGQTQGLSPFTDPLIESFGIDRISISISYLFATLLGAAAMPLVGRAMDRFGARSSIFWIGSGLVISLLAISFVTEIFGLTAGYVGLRMFGQGAIILASTTLIARTVTHRSGLALGISAAIGSAGISIAPVGIERLIAGADFATAWRVEAAIVALVVFPLVFLLPKDSKQEITETGSLVTAPSRSGHGAGVAIRTTMFWVFTGALFVAGMMSTGLAFHLISILGKQGLTPLEAAANFIPQTFAALLGTLTLGAVVDRIDPRVGVVISMMALCGAMLMLSFVTPGIFGILFGVLLGLSQGALKGVEAAGFVRYFGRAHIGSIRGIATGVGLASSALGPLFFAIGLEVTGSYLEASYLGALLPLSIILLALFAKEPQKFEDPSQDSTATTDGN